MSLGKCMTFKSRQHNMNEAKVYVNVADWDILKGSKTWYLDAV